jgi:hypothetical protein
MNRITRFFATAAVAATLAVPCAVQAQTYSTYPATPYSQTVFLLGSGNWAASSFVFNALTPASLTSLDVDFQEINVQGFTGPLDITFLTDLTGTTMQGASALESWSVPVSSNDNGSYSFASLLNPTLLPGHTYWVELSTIGYGWNWYAGSATTAITSQSTDGGLHWTDSGPGGSPAFDVYVSAPGTTLSTVTPEPATMSLMALGLVGMAGMRRRKRSR